MIELSRVELGESKGGHDTRPGHSLFGNGSARTEEDMCSPYMRGQDAVWREGVQSGSW